MNYWLIRWPSPVQWQRTQPLWGVHSRKIVANINTISVGLTQWKSLNKNILQLDGKTKVRAGDKVIKLRDKRELWGRFLIIRGSRPEFVQKLEETIAEYEMFVVPRSFCLSMAFFYISMDKASWIYAIKVVKLPMLNLCNPSLIPVKSRLVFRPVFSLLTPCLCFRAWRKHQTYTEDFWPLKWIHEASHWMVRMDGGWLMVSLVSRSIIEKQNAQKMATTSTEFEIHSAIKLTKSLKELLSSSKVKKSTRIWYPASSQLF